MTTNAERVAEIIYSHMSSWDDEAQAVRATQDLSNAGLLVSEDLIAEKQAHAELRAWVESLHPRVGSVEGGAVTFHKANFLDEITRVLEGDDG